MTRRYLSTLPFIFLLLWIAPSLAEHPIGSSMEEMIADNVQRLVITKQCKSCYLVNADLSKTHLIGVDLRGADLVGADLSWSNLEGADLNGANLTGANLTGAFLTNASMVGANLDNVNFSQAQLYSVDVTGASMENLNLTDATVVSTPISIGGSIEPVENSGEVPPIFILEHDQLILPSSEPWYIPRLTSPGILDIPPQTMPQT